MEHLDCTRIPGNPALLVCLVAVWERFLLLQPGMLGRLTRDLETQNLGF